MTRAPEAVVAPMQSQNQVDAIGQRSAQQIASEVLDAHRKGLRARRQRDLLSEKYLLHIDGTADFQWADIIDGQRVEIPRLISDYRKTENILRLVVDNAVAHHTTMALQFHAQAPPGRQSAQKALLDSMWLNDLSQRQDFNGLFAEALYMAMPAGFCPVHGYWREDAAQDWQESVSYGEGGQSGMAGMIDCFVGNPFATVFNIGAKRHSIRWCSYERVLPAELVRRKFAHIPGVAGLQGSTRRPSASEFQMIARQWSFGGLGLHGTPVLSERRDDQELLSLICREEAPFTHGPNDPGRLKIIIVPGEVDLRRSESPQHSILVADQPLPGMDFSFENVYSHHRGNDVHGKPWIEDLDQLQVDLNIALSKRWEAINRQFDAPIVAPGGAIAEDLADLDGYALLELEPNVAQWRPAVMEWPASILQGLDNEIAERRRSMYTMGGYQASSRGEAPGSRMAASAIALLQQADNTIHGPVNQRFQRSACNFGRRMHSQFKYYGDVPWLLTVTGEDYAHLADRYVDKTKISQESPNYVLVNAFGSSPEMFAQEIIEMSQLRGADGQPFITTDEARRLHPNRRLFSSMSDSRHVKRRRAKAIAAAMEQMAAAFREQTGFQETDPRHPWVAKAAQTVFFDAEGRFPRKRDDLLEAHIDAYSEIIQDETADPIARAAIEMRQNMYFQWQQAMAGIPVSPEAGAPQPGGGAPPVRGGVDGRQIAADGQRRGSASTISQSEERQPVAATAR